MNVVARGSFDKEVVEGLEPKATAFDLRQGAWSTCTSVGQKGYHVAFGRASKSDLLEGQRRQRGRDDHRVGMLHAAIGVAANA